MKTSIDMFLSAGKLFLLISPFIILIPQEGSCQETIFSILVGKTKAADAFYDGKNYRNALELYLEIEKGSPDNKDIYLKIARSYHELGSYEQVTIWYEKYAAESDLPPADIFRYAESLTAMKSYGKAVEWYNKYLVTNPDREEVIKKIWRIRNIRYLYEDSMYYKLRRIDINSEYAEFRPLCYDSSLIFLSNRKEIRLINKVDGFTNMPFFRLYHAGIVRYKSDSVYHYTKPKLFCAELKAEFHEGPVAFYDNGNKMVYTKSNASKENKGKRTLQLLFASKKEGIWTIDEPFPFNSPDHSISAPAITNDGKVLYFASDMKGGFGGDDLYRSVYENGHWTKPANLGNHINTYCDESFPYIFHNNKLYFSSCGHPGMGGMDIFNVDLYESGFGEVENMGYPVNSHYDETGIVFSDDGSNGYLSSNRQNGGADDDIYEFKTTLQSYPLSINGTLKYMEINKKDSSDLKTLPGATLLVIDNARDVIVHQTISDSSGQFLINIPYFSRYKMRVVEPDGNETVVSLNISRSAKLNNNHEVVLVREAVTPNEE